MHQFCVYCCKCFNMFRGYMYMILLLIHLQTKALDFILPINCGPIFNIFVHSVNYLHYYMQSFYLSFMLQNTYRSHWSSVASWNNGCVGNVTPIQVCFLFTNMSKINVFFSGRKKAEVYCTIVCSKILASSLTTVVKFEKE